MAFDPVVATNLVAAVGPVTSFGEGAATSVGAGMVLGGFLAGVISLALGWAKGEREEFVVASGYVGGVAMVIALICEAIIG